MRAGRRETGRHGKGPIVSRSVGVRTVLIVEDDDAIRLLIREVLTDAGFDTREARTGREGLERARADRVLLVLPWLLGLAERAAAGPVGQLAREAYRELAGAPPPFSEKNFLAAR